MAGGAVKYKSCTTHVHTSFDGHATTPLGSARLISMAAIYFENAINDLVPLHRQCDRHEHCHCRSNTNDHFCQGPDAECWLINMQEAWHQIRKTETTEELACVVCKGHPAPQPAKYPKGIGLFEFDKRNTHR